MTKKHFIELANYIRDTRIDSRGMDVVSNHCEPFTPKQLEHLADFCQSQNPRFNRYRWLDYIAGKCGPSGGSIKRAS